MKSVRATRARTQKGERHCKVRKMATEKDQSTKEEKEKVGLPSHIRNNLIAQKREREREIQTINTQPASGRAANLAKIRIDT